MAKKEKDYKRLSGRKRTFFGYNTLYLGKDHVLGIHCRAFTEDYKRFYYKDIQTVITHKTSNHIFQNIFIILLLAFFLWMAYFLRQDGGVVFLVFAGLCLAGLIYNLWLGPTSVTHIQTAVQTERLRSLGRFRHARKAMNLIKELAEQAQGVISPEELGVKLAEMPQKPAPAASTAERAVKSESGNVHKFMFGLLILDGALTGFAFLANNLALSLSGTAVSLGLLAALVIALVKQQGSDLSNSTKKTSWAVTVYCGLNIIFGYAIFMIAAVKNPGVANNQWEMFKVASQISPADSTTLAAFYIFFAIAAVGLGLLGLLTFTGGKASTPAVDDSNPEASGL